MGNICIIGPRASGKTTYLAALAYKKRLSSKSKNFNLQPMNDDSRAIADKAENIICQGESVEPTVIGDVIQSVDDLPFYSFNIEIKKNVFSKTESFQLNVRDYPGEVFEKIAEPNLSDSIHEEFIKECLMKDVVGCLILLTGWEKGTDNFYNRVMNRFIDLMDVNDRLGDLKLAVAMSKCERGELWPGRIEPEIDLFGVHLPNTQLTLKERVPPKNLRFYALSTFGVLRRTDPRPNRIDEQGKDGKASVLREASHWHPYNMIDPLYWLSKKG
jgi:Double-GTPase 1